MHILIIDNYDSFTYNLYHMVEAVMPDHFRLSVRRNDEIGVRAADRYDACIISPGPGLPKDSGISCELIEQYGTTKPILGVCLGHQAMAEVFGGRLLNLPEVLHGTPVNTSLTDIKDPLFTDCPEQFETGRYHSWVIDPEHTPEDFHITAMDDRNLIQAISHRQYNLKGVQFHPESIMTAPGRQILKNWVTLTAGADFRCKTP